jgi:uncharacterized protein (DUF1800 family)
MAIDPTGAVAALNRFGLGARPGDLAAAAGDPRGFLLEELRAPDIALLLQPPLPGAAAALQRFYLDQQQKRMARERAAMAPPEAAPSPVGKPEPPPEQMLFRDEAMARYAKQFAASAGFVERLVAFWSNHFAVSLAKGAHLRVTAGPFEREAIRPHVLGKFSDMLLAVARHPAMILYLDNQRSIGPNAAPGRFAGRGLNENLAREILELHTLGADGGYGQADVSAFARILTGWSVAEAESETGEPGAFIFKANWREPGAQTLLGKIYAQPGAAQGEAALRDLSAHPRTAKHIAFKFARHFIADAPPADLVGKLAKSFLLSDGDLRLLAETLLADERAFRAPATKLRAPQEFVIAAARASGFLPHEPGPLLHLANTLGQPLWQPAGPNGFSDAADVWGAPEAMKTRLDVSLAMAQRLRDSAPPLALLDVIAGVAASRDTRQAVERAESRQQALAILFMSPEFQRR